MAYRRVRGKMYKRYLGRPAEVSAARLEAAAAAIQALAATGGSATAARAPRLATAAPEPPSAFDYTLLPRPRLTARVPVRRLGQLTTICASAGYGKSTLLQELAAQSPWPVATLALEATDNDPGRLWPRLLGRPGAAHPNLAALSGGSLALGSEQLSAAYSAVVRDALADESAPLLLILDDVHLLTADAALGMLAGLCCPPPAGCHIVLASRVAPPLPLARLGAGGQLTELGAADLKLVADETAQVLVRGGVHSLSDGQRDVLHRRVEGWAAGLRLAVLALRQGDDPDTLLAALGGDHPFIFDYLAEELFARQPPELQHVLVTTAVLDRVCAELCAAVLNDPEEGPGRFAAALRAGLLLLPADGERRWYRYHPLMAEFLRARLAQTGPLYEREIHRRASAWFERTGDIPAAIQHALAAQDEQEAFRLVDAHAVSWLFAGSSHHTVAAWLDALPPALLRTSPRLCILRFWLCFTISLSEGERWLAAARQALPRSPAVAAFERGEPPPANVAADEQLLLGMLATMETYLGCARHGSGGEAHGARLALAWLPPEETLYRSMVMVNVGNSALAGGNLAVAEQAFAETMRLRLSPERVHAIPRAAYALTWAQIRAGAVGRAARTIETAEAVVALRPSPAAQERLRYLLDGSRNAALNDAVSEADAQRLRAELESYLQLEHVVRRLKIRAREKLAAGA